MADWYEVEEQKETVHVRASNTRTAFDRGFRLLCGMNYKVTPGETIHLRVTRLRGNTEMVKVLERTYQESHKKTR